MPNVTNIDSGKLSTIIRKISYRKEEDHINIVIYKKVGKLINNIILTNRKF